jgi:DnaK suppressor protein
MSRREEALRRQALELERQELLARLKGLREAVRVEVDTDPEEGDPDLHERDKNLTLMAALESELASVEDALRALRLGKYGICDRCGEQIDPERLAVRPEATHCVRCQTEVERLARRGLARQEPARRERLSSEEEEEEDDWE